MTRAALSAEIRKLTGIKFVRGVCFNSAKTFEVRTHTRSHAHTHGRTHAHARRREFTFTFAHSHSTAEYELHYTIEHKLRLRLPYGELHCATHSSESVFFFFVGGNTTLSCLGSVRTRALVVPVASVYPRLKVPQRAEVRRSDARLEY